MIKFVFSKIIIVISKVLTVLRLRARTVNQLNKLRSESHKIDDCRGTISQLMGNEKLVALDVGAQGGFFNANIFSKNYNDFFDPIVVEPIPGEAKKLEEHNYKVIPNALWSTNCKKKLYILGRRPGSSSMYKPNKKVLNLYGFKKKTFNYLMLLKKLKLIVQRLQKV